MLVHKSTVVRRQKIECEHVCIGIKYYNNSLVTKYFNTYSTTLGIFKYIVSIYAPHLPARPRATSTFEIILIQDFNFRNCHLSILRNDTVNLLLLDTIFGQ